jgi:Ca2+-binding RTX toxin-like protein
LTEARVTLEVSAGIARLTFDHGAAGVVYLPGKPGATSGVSLTAAGDYTLALRMTARTDLVTVGASGVSLNADDFPEVLWNAPPTDIHVAVDAGSDTVSGLGGRGTGDAVAAPMRIFGGDGNDILGGGLAADHLEGGAGNDRFATAPQADGADVYLGGGGLDLMSYGNTEVSAMRVHDGRWHERLGDPVGQCLGRTPVSATGGGLPCNPDVLDPAGHLGVLVTTGAFLDGETWRPVTWPLAAVSEESTRCLVTTAAGVNPVTRRPGVVRTWSRAPLVTDTARVIAKGSGRILDITDEGCAARFARGGATAEGAEKGDPMALWCLASVVTEGDLFDSVETVQGTAGQDVMVGGGCETVSLFGLGGDDVLYPGLGNEGGRIHGGDGDDLLLFGLDIREAATPNGATTFAGGRGTDLVLCPDCQTGLYLSVDSKPNDGFRATTGYAVGYRPRVPCRAPRKQQGEDGDNVLRLVALLSSLHHV